MSESSKGGPIKLFTFHGVPLSLGSSGQYVGDCPFCGRPKHFFVSKKGLWDCKRCGAKGNPLGFIRALHKQFRDATETADYKAISKARKGIPYSAFQERDLAFDGSRWYIPTRNEEGNITNLRVWDGPGQPVLASPSLKLGIFGLERLAAHPSDPVYLCEGEWDAVALDWARQKANAPGVVLGVPGAGTFKADWAEFLQGRAIYLVYDNDDPGESGMNRTTELLSGVAASISRIRWPVKSAKGYDVNDYFGERVKTPKKAWKELHAMFVLDHENKDLRTYDFTVPGWTRTAKGKPPSYSSVLKAFKQYIHMDANSEKALLVTMASILSSRLPGDPLWMFIVGPAGSGKTLLLESFRDSPLTHYESNLTPHSLVSGFNPSSGDDPSLIPNLIGRSLLLKDYTELKALPQITQEEIYGVLRGAYDGRVEKTFGNGVKRIYENCRFSLVAGVTHVIHGDTRATLGERFLKYELIRSGHDPDAHIRAALSGMGRMAEAEHHLRDVCCDFLDRTINLSDAPKIPGWVIDRIVSLSQIIAQLRTTVHRGYGGDIQYRSRPEIGTRLSKQLAKLGQCVGMSLMKPLDQSIYQIMERVAFDTAIGWNLDIVGTLMKHYPHPVLIKDLGDESAIAQSSLKRKLDDLLELESVERRRIKGQVSTSGQPPYGYIVTKQIADLWRKAKVGLK